MQVEEEKEKRTAGAGHYIWRLRANNRWWIEETRKQTLRGVMIRYLVFLPLSFADVEANNNHFYLFSFVRSSKIRISLGLFAFTSFLLFHACPIIWTPWWMMDGLCDGKIRQIQRSKTIARRRRQRVIKTRGCNEQEDKEGGMVFQTNSNDGWYAHSVV